jgi:hypothetical protein
MPFQNEVGDLIETGIVSQIIDSVAAVSKAIAGRTHSAD